MMNRRLFLSTAVLSALALAACDSKPSALPSSGPLSLETLKKSVTGFSVGQPMANRTVYVFYDMQCPHCGHLWFNAKPLLNQVRFVWVPVAFLGPASLAQGATILASPTPEAQMDEHETSIGNRQGGLTADATAKEKFGELVKANTELLKKQNVKGVPYLVTQDPTTQALVSAEGALDLNGLRAFLKL